MLDDKDKDWMEVYEYLTKVNEKPTAEDIEAKSIERNFFDFLLLTLLADKFTSFSPSEREERMEDLLKRWRRNLYGQVNEHVKKHETMLAKAPDREQIEQMVGDGEHNRLQKSKAITRAAKKVRGMLTSILTAIRKSEGGEGSGNQAS